MSALRLLEGGRERPATRRKIEVRGRVRASVNGVVLLPSLGTRDACVRGHGDDEKCEACRGEDLSLAPAPEPA